jgi:hypothetical protein
MGQALAHPNRGDMISIKVLHPDRGSQTGFVRSFL